MTKSHKYMREIYISNISDTYVTTSRISRLYVLMGKTEPFDQKDLEKLLDLVAEDIRKEIINKHRWTKGLSDGLRNKALELIKRYNLH